MMNLKKLYSKSLNIDIISIPLLKQNLYRFWPLPLIAFLAYFFSTVFPIIISYNSLENNINYIKTYLTNMHPLLLSVNLMLPVIAAVLVFKYLNISASVAVIHSMPFTRNQLFCSNVLSGLIMSVSPMLLNGILLLIISKVVKIYKPISTMFPSKYMNDAILLEDPLANVFSTTNILGWMWQTLIIIFFIYAISVFAGIVTGHSIMHICTAIGFNFLLPGLFSLCIVYCKHMLYGYTEGDWVDICLFFSPFLEIFLMKGKFSLLLTSIYIFVPIIILIITAFLYNKRKLEKATEPLVFNFMLPFVNYLIAFLGMSLFGFYFITFTNYSLKYLHQTSFYIGLVLGAILFFIIGRMIVKKTLKVFNLITIKSFGIFFLITTIFVGSLSLDLTNYETRIPDVSSLKTARVDNFFTNSNDNRFMECLFNSENNFFKKNIDKNGNFVFTEKENLKVIGKLHQSILNADFKHNIFNGHNYNLTFIYNLGLPFDMYRYYTIPHDFIANSLECKMLFESKEFKNFYSLNNISLDKITEINLINPIVPDYTRIEIKKEHLNEFFNLLEKDFQQRSFESQYSLVRPYAEVSMTFQKDNLNKKPIYENVSVYINMTDKNTINWLNEKGYAIQFEITADMIESISVSFVETTLNNNVVYKKIPAQTVDYDNLEQNNKTIIITMPDEITKILNTCKYQQNYYVNYYSCTIKLTLDAAAKLLFNHLEYETIANDKMKNYASSYDNSLYTNNFYYDLKSAPDFIKEKFEIYN